MAAACNLAAYLKTAQGQRADATDTAVLADACEAIIGALYLDGGLEAARGFIASHWDDVMRADLVPPKDAKTALQEWAQGARTAAARAIAWSRPKGRRMRRPL